MLPPQPAFTRPDPTADDAWWWRLEDASGATVESADFGGERFSSQADAESWVGEVFADLAAVGVDAVTLFEHERQVYGPMSLHA
jgi:hypothetical protein